MGDCIVLTVRTLGHQGYDPHTTNFDRLFDIRSVLWMVKTSNSSVGALEEAVLMMPLLSFLKQFTSALMNSQASSSCTLLLLNDR